MVTKGALPNILAICSSVEVETGKPVEISDFKEKIEQQYEEFSEKGFRTLGVAYREMDQQATYRKGNRNRDDLPWFPFLF